MSNLPTSIVYNNRDLKILSPEGMVSFLGLNKITKDRYLRLKFSNGVEIECSEDHPFDTIEGIQRAKSISKKTEVLTKNEGCFITSRRLIRKKIDLYDIVDSGTQNLYYLNDIVSHNCEFIGSSNTLVNSAKLSQLIASTTNPIYKELGNSLSIYESPIDGHTYVMTVDVSEGLGLDYSTFSIFDVTSLPYKQVATYRNNTIVPMLYPTILYTIGKKYNDAFILVEINSIGLQVADILHFDLDYGNLIKIQAKGKQGQGTTPGFTKKIAYGIKTSKQTKIIGCANLKTLLESDKLIIPDERTVTELTTFATIRTSFAAEEGTNDDLVMTLVHFGWLTTQRQFKETINSDIRTSLQQEQMSIMDADIVPFGIIHDGLEETVEHDGQDYWFNATVF